MQFRILNFLVFVVVIVLIALTNTIEAKRAGGGKVGGGRPGRGKPASGKVGGEAHDHLMSIAKHGIGEFGRETARLMHRG